MRTRVDHSPSLHMDRIEFYEHVMVQLCKFEAASGDDRCIAYAGKNLDGYLVVRIYNAKDFE